MKKGNRLTISFDFFLIIVKRDCRLVTFYYCIRVYIYADVCSVIVESKWSRDNTIIVVSLHKHIRYKENKGS